MRYILILIITFFCSTISAGTIDPSTPQQKYLEYGKKFRCIARLCGKDRAGTTYCASAVAIKPNWFLTAAHVVKDIETCHITIENREKICVDKIYCHNKFDDNIFGYNDIALGYVAQGLDLDFYPELYTDKDETGKICSMSGYGLTGTFLTGSKDSDSNRRAGSNIIDGIQKQLLICTPSKSHQNSTELEFLIASGDSGGGLFIDSKLAGINSCVIAADRKPDSSYTDESGHTRVSEHTEWIKSIINSNSNEK